MATIFNGRAFASEKEISLSNRVLGLKTRNVYPKLASIIIGDDPASKLYVGLKKKAAERIGAELDIYYLKENTKLEEILVLIGTLNVDDTVQGIMVQLPLPETLSDRKSQIVSAISPEKDVDGLQEESDFLHPTSKAVIEILDVAKKDPDSPFKNVELKVVVVGGTGMVGTPLAKELEIQGYKVIKCDTNTTDLKSVTLQGDVLISCAGVPDLVKGEMVKKGAIVIDVGSPVGDIDFESVEAKASFITPVPGGVGPVTISCLLENLIGAC